MDRNPLALGRGTRCAVVLAVIAAALGAAGPANAQPRKESATKTAPRATSTSTSTPALAAPAAPRSQVPLPPPPAGPSVAPRRVEWLAVSAGPWAGLDAGKGYALGVDYGFLRTPSSWSRVQLELRLAATISRPSAETELTTTFLAPPFGTPVTISSGVETMNAWVVEVVPTARLRLPIGSGSTFALLADGGLGLAQTVETYERDEMFAGSTERSVYQTSLVFRLAAGMSFDLSERTRAVFLPLALSLELGTGFSAYVPTLGLAYRL